ncbi:hypothetical protein CH263_06445 [Rhodococcus sp. 06-1059B-a]|nr:DUF2637 domain-containing protein [Rhodococcus sp. 06-1059B-a]OZD70551.1 hypothetical protein CH263_06445 [Rhodococcus sp. 06-1059B-a]
MTTQSHHRGRSATTEPDATPIHPRILQGALAVAVVLTFGIAGASFWLSFAALRELAVMAGTNEGRAWVIPVVLDGAIVSTTVTAIALSNHVDERTVRGRRFVVAILRIAAAASIAGNSYHAVLSATVLPAVVSAGIATIAPIALLAMTEVLAVILRAPRTPRGEETMPPGEGAVPVVAGPTNRDVAPEPEPVRDRVGQQTVLAAPDLPDIEDDVDVLSPEVLDTVRLRQLHPEWSWARIGQETDGVVASTAMRRFRRWEESSVESVAG